MSLSHGTQEDKSPVSGKQQDLCILYENRYFISILRLTDVEVGIANIACDRYVL